MNIIGLANALLGTFLSIAWAIMFKWAGEGRIVIADPQNAPLEMGIAIILAGWFFWQIPFFFMRLWRSKQ